MSSKNVKEIVKRLLRKQRVVCAIYFWQTCTFFTWAWIYKASKLSHNSHLGIQAKKGLRVVLSQVSFHTVQISIGKAGVSSLKRQTFTLKPGFDLWLKSAVHKSLNILTSQKGANSRWGAREWNWGLLAATAVTLLKCVDHNQQTFWIRAEEGGTSPAGCDTQEESRDWGCQAAIS